VTTLLPPMPYSGGKQRIARDLVALMPDHDSYVEPFAGALSVLLAKPQAGIEVVNDLDRRIVTFWRVLRDRPADLERVCTLTPHSRAENQAAHDYLNATRITPPDELELARSVWVALTQSRGAHIRHSGFRFVRGGNRLPLARYLDGYLQRIAPAAARLRQVTLENRDALDVIRAYQRSGCLLYVDPPYLADVRNGPQYAVEFDQPEQHEQLLDMLLASPAMVMLSGYAHPMYDDALRGWERHTFPARAMTGAARTEVVWCNYVTHPRLEWSLA